MEQTVKVPAEIQRLKGLIDKESELEKVKADLKSQIDRGVAYFNKALTPPEIKKGLETARRLISRLEENDASIREVQLQIASILEAITTDISMTVKVLDHQNAVGRQTGTHTITFGGEYDDVPLSELWNLRILCRLFGANPSDILIKKRV